LTSGVYKRTEEMNTGKYKRTSEMKIGKYKRTEETKRKMSIAQTGKKKSEVIKRKMSETHKLLIGKKSSNWKGGITPLEYDRLHRWINRYFIKPDFCEICGKLAFGKMEISNKSGKLIRDINNFQWAHQGCHRKYDNKNGIIHEGLEIDV